MAAKVFVGVEAGTQAVNISIDGVLKKLGFTRLKSDVGIYMKRDGDSAIYIALYVDDLFLVGELLEEIEKVKAGLTTEFKMEDLGEARFLLGVEIRRQANGDVLLVQEKYAGDVVKRFSMEGSKTLSTPMELGTHLDIS